MSSPEPSLPIHLPLDERSGPAVRASREQSAAMVMRALEDFASEPIRATPRANHALMWASAAVGLLCIVGGVAAARFYFDFSDHAKPRAAATSPAAHRIPEALARVPATEPLSDPEPTKPATEPTRIERAEPAPPRAAGRSSHSERAPEDLLQKANRQRAAGQFRDAAASYAIIYEQFPHAASAYVARVAGASLELEHLANPMRARRLFEQALRERPAGPLDLEARQGLSVALRDLEDRSAEIATLQALVGAHPDSPAARRAQVRLRELGANTL
jgi:tetratricopeptide (TPR) repeat protein